MDEENIFEYETTCFAFGKYEITPELSKEEINLCMKFCEFVNKTKKGDSSKWYNYLKSKLSKEIATDFITEYVDKAFYPSGEEKHVGITTDLMKVNSYRKALSELLKIIPPSIKKRALPK